MSSDFYTISHSVDPEFEDETIASMDGNAVFAIASRVASTMQPGKTYTIRYDKDRRRDRITGKIVHTWTLEIQEEIER